MEVFIVKAQFHSDRYFKTHEGWFVELRSGDELTEIDHLKPKITKNVDLDMVFAGPFLSKATVERWFIAFLSFYAKPRKPPVSYIRDDIVVTDLNSVYI